MLNVTFKRNFFAAEVLDCLCDTPLQCLIFSPLPLKTTDPTRFLCPGSNQNTAELHTIMFVQCVFKSVQLEPKPQSKGPHATLSLEEEKSLQVCFSDNASASLCGVARTNFELPAATPFWYGSASHSNPSLKKSPEGGFLLLCDTLLKLSFLF